MQSSATFSARFSRALVMNLVRQAAVTGYSLKAGPYCKRFLQAGRAGRLILRESDDQE